MLRLGIAARRLGRPSFPAPARIMSQQEQPIGQKRRLSLDSQGLVAPTPPGSPPKRLELADIPKVDAEAKWQEWQAEAARTFPGVRKDARGIPPPTDEILRLRALMPGNAAQTMASGRKRRARYRREAEEVRGAAGGAVAKGPVHRVPGNIVSEHTPHARPEEYGMNPRQVLERLKEHGASAASLRVTTQCMLALQRDVCVSCWMQRRACVCGKLRPVNLRHRVLLYLHNREYAKGVNTGKFVVRATELADYVYRTRYMQNQGSNDESSASNEPGSASTVSSSASDASNESTGDHKTLAGDSENTVDDPDSPLEKVPEFEQRLRVHEGIVGGAHPRPVVSRMFLYGVERDEQELSELLEREAHKTVVLYPAPNACMASEFFARRLAEQRERQEQQQSEQNKDPSDSASSSANQNRNESQNENENTGVEDTGKTPWDALEPQNIILIDGTWSGVTSMHRRIPKSIPRVIIPLPEEQPQTQPQTPSESQSQSQSQSEVKVNENENKDKDVKVNENRNEQQLKNDDDSDDHAQSKNTGDENAQPANEQSQNQSQQQAQQSQSQQPQLKHTGQRDSLLNPVRGQTREDGYATIEALAYLFQEMEAPVEVCEEFLRQCKVSIDHCRIQSGQAPVYGEFSPQELVWMRTSAPNTPFLWDKYAQGPMGEEAAIAAALSEAEE